MEPGQENRVSLVNRLRKYSNSSYVCSLFRAEIYQTPEPVYTEGGFSLGDVIDTIRSL